MFYFVCSYSPWFQCLEHMDAGLINSCTMSLWAEAPSHIFLNGLAYGTRGYICALVIFIIHILSDFCFCRTLPKTKANLKKCCSRSCVLVIRAMCEYVSVHMQCIIFPPQWICVTFMISHTFAQAMSSLTEPSVLFQIPSWKDHLYTTSCHGGSLYVEFGLSFNTFWHASHEPIWAIACKMLLFHTRRGRDDGTFIWLLWWYLFLPAPFFLSPS